MRSYARAIAALKRKAEKRGDREAALFLLQEFANHADAFDRANLPGSDRLVIRFLARAVREILEGKNPRAALCLDSEGRPQAPIERDLLLAFQVHAKQQELRCLIKEAINSVARQRKLGAPTVRAAWNKHYKLIARISEG
jgi:hypothetical protein